MTDESDEEYIGKTIIHDKFRARIDDPPNVRFAVVPGSAFPAKLVLVLQDRPEIERGFEVPARGAILEVDMTYEVVEEIYAQVLRLARTMDWPLPE